jgi:RNA-binding protein
MPAHPLPGWFSSGHLQSRPMVEDTPVTAAVLAPRTLRALRARAHALKPVVWISEHGVSEGALREIDRALTSHELIKIHAAGDDRTERRELLTLVCERVGAHAVQIIGKMLVVFRPRPEPEPTQAKPDPRDARRQQRSNRPGQAGKDRRRPESAGRMSARSKRSV